MSHLAHVQIASVPEHNEPDRGEVAYDHILALLGRLGYEGFVGCEYRPFARTEESLVWLSRLWCLR